jgi:diguanylate cyclase (GGDEF)-like protein
MNQSNEVIDHIAKFTSKRDKDLIALSLLKSVNSMMNSSKSFLVSIDKKGIVLSKIILEGASYVVIDTNIDVDNELIIAFKHMQKNSIEEYSLNINSVNTLICLLHQNSPVEQFLVLELKEKNNNIQSYVLSGILSIYDNFISLLNESQVDELTGLANRKTFEYAISKVFADASLPSETVDNDKQLNTPKTKDNLDSYWLAMLDIDHFKLVNDRYGHIYGDEILIHFAQIIKSSFRNADLQFRFGGEEFVILLKAATKEDCFNTLLRFKKNVEDYNFPKVNQITVSIGAVEFKKGTFHVTTIDYADQALYHSKKSGRNTITFFEDMLMAGYAKLLNVEDGEVDLF